MGQALGPGLWCVCDGVGGDTRQGSVQAPAPCRSSSVYLCEQLGAASCSGPALAGLWPCLEGCSWALPPTQQLHTGSIEARTFLAACVTGEEGAGPLPQIRKAWLPQEEALDASQHIWRS